MDRFRLKIFGEYYIAIIKSLNKTDPLDDILISLPVFYRSGLSDARGHGSKLRHG